MNVNPPLTQTRWNMRDWNWVEYVAWMKELVGRPPLSKFVILSIINWICSWNGDMLRKTKRSRGISRAGQMLFVVSLSPCPLSGQEIPEGAYLKVLSIPILALISGVFRRVVKVVAGG